MGLHLALPHDFVLSPTWIYPVLMGGFLVLLVAGDPGLVDHERGWIRVVTNLMIVLIALSNLFAIVRLCDGILSSDQPEFAQQPTQLLGIGAIVWATNVIAFALWYWELDRGGPGRRADGTTAPPDFLFPQMSDPDLAAPGWTPAFVDYFYTSFTNATAFSPTDVLPLARWAKLVMMLQSAVSLVTVGLVVARAVNVLK